MAASTTSDVLVLGGGVLGLSVAYQLALDGLSVTLVERGQPGREASWAGAGVLPPASWYVDDPALDTLCLAAAASHARWSEQLREAIGVDDEYWQCGAEYRITESNRSYVQAVLRRWRRLGVVLEDALVPSEAQVRNPRRLRALLEACKDVGVQFHVETEVTHVERGPGDRIDAVHTNRGDFSSEAVCFAAGCWTPALAGRAGSASPGRPVRGQMLLLRPGGHTLKRIVHLYPYYAVPRRDGRVLIGATLEEAGFEKLTTRKARAELLAAARRIDPRLADARIEAHWAGLRPASDDALPQIGPLPGLVNAWVATGHHRSGLQLAPPTAEMISAMIRGVDCDLPKERFDPARFVAEPVPG